MYYHIFAGKDSGVQYHYVAQSPPIDYFSTSPYIPQYHKLLAKEKYTSETKLPTPDEYRNYVDVNERRMWI